MFRSPYTKEQLEQMMAEVKDQLQEIESEHPDCRPLDPMTKEDAKDQLDRLMSLAIQRPLTKGECFLHEQLLQVFEMAVRAEMLKLPKGQAYFVVPKSQIDEMRGLYGREGDG